MDRRIENSLEDYLRGDLDSRKRAEFEQSLAESGGEAQREVEVMRTHSTLIRKTLRAPEGVEPRAGFYARVLERIEAERASNSIWAAFLEPQFFRRLAFASATLLVLLGITIYTGGSEDRSNFTPNAEMTPEQALAIDQDSLPVATSVSDQQSSRDALLIDLTTYRE